MNILVFIILPIASSKFYGPPIFSSEYCAAKHETRKIKIILGHENLRLSCPCKTLIPKWSIYPEQAGVNWLRITKETQKLELLAFGKVTSNELSRPRILTKGGGKNHYPGSVCQFPFVVNMKDQHTCLESGRSDGRCYCGIKQSKHIITNLDKKADSESWGFCGCAKPAVGLGPIITIIPERGFGATGNSGEKCVFPFKFRDQWHNQCITDDGSDDKAKITQSRCFCGLVSDLDSEFKWGLCPCASVPVIGTWSNWSDWKEVGNLKIETRQRFCRSPHGMAHVKAHCNGLSVEKKKISFSENKFSVLHNSDLDVFDGLMSKTDAGMYFCSDSSESVENQHLLSKYDIDIIDPIDGVNVKRKSVLEKRYVWGDYQKCNLCGDLPGEMRRFGFDAGNNLGVQYKDCHVPCQESKDQIRGYKTISVSKLGSSLPELEKKPTYEVVNVDFTGNVVLDCEQLLFNNEHRSSVAWLVEDTPIRFQAGLSSITSNEFDFNKFSEFEIDAYDKLFVHGLVSKIDVKCLVNQRLAKEFLVVLDHDLDILKTIEYAVDTIVYGSVVCSMLVMVFVIFLSMVGLWRYNKS